MILESRLGFEPATSQSRGNAHPHELQELMCPRLLYRPFLLQLINTDLPLKSTTPRFKPRTSATKVCDINHYTIREAIKQQIVRLQVKSDVFIPDVQSSIIEKVKQKLKEHGMLGNITVTWRVQPDGNIFHEKNNDDL
ncbi:hypothetical protein KOW79_022741 [Hemibagrus wyckioides]|uniref:Uncharacterized protein n=1 Tax=Hemibagrus wyckioides TaxID=337641 RepID=A0A9D3N2G2_9TELE|nr:hypothetical protein KOW79_022741 [Hemibagrus wyckioides]